MSKKKKQSAENKIDNYYDLKIDKVNELVAALKDEIPEDAEQISMNITDCTGVDDPKNYKRNGTQKQFDPYKTDFLSRIPKWIKAIFIKWWFAGVVAYFVIMGLGTYVTDDLDRAVLAGAVLGILVDLMVNPIFRFIQTADKEYNDYMMFPFPFKSYWTFFTNTFYYIFVTMCTVWVYQGVNILGNLISGTDLQIYLTVEPLLYGVFAVIVDMLFIGIKDGIVRLVRKSKKREITANV